MAKRGGFPGGGMPGEHGEFNEAGAEDAASDGRTGKRKWSRKNLQQQQEEAL